MTEEHPAARGAVRGGVQERRRLHRPEGERPAVPHHVPRRLGEASGPAAAAGHDAADSAVVRPEVEHSLPDERRHSQPEGLGLGRDAKPGGRHSAMLSCC